MREQDQDHDSLPVFVCRCHLCGCELTLENYTLIDAGPVCLDCAHRVREAALQAAIQAANEVRSEQETSRALQEVASKAVQALAAPDAQTAVSEVLARLGGVHGWANLYTAMLVEAARRNPGGRTVLQALKWVLDAMQAIDNRELRKSQLASMSDAELEDTVRRLIAQESHGTT